MTPYTILSSGVGTQEASDLSVRLSAWHDAMVAHERRLRSGVSNDSCDDECPHAEARTLWSEAVATFGTRAHDLVFLSSRAQHTRRRASSVRSRDTVAEAADRARRVTSEIREAREP
jgi:hypothetical protein